MTHESTHLTCVHITVYKLYFNKVVFLKRQTSDKKQQTFSYKVS